jgi:hypothetical protein
MGTHWIQPSTVLASLHSSLECIEHVYSDQETLHKLLQLPSRKRIGHESESGKRRERDLFQELDALVKEI